MPRLCDALARAGFIALIHWSDAIRDRRLVPEDADDIASVFASLLARPDVDPARSGLYGTCVGGTFALLAAAATESSAKLAAVRKSRLRGRRMSPRASAKLLAPLTTSCACARAPRRDARASSLRSRS